MSWSYYKSFSNAAKMIKKKRSVVFLTQAAAGAGVTGPKKKIKKRRGGKKAKGKLMRPSGREQIQNKVG